MKIYNKGELTWDRLTKKVLAQLRGTNEEVMPKLAEIFMNEDFRRDFGPGDIAVW